MGSWKDKFLALGLLWLRVLMGVGIAHHGYGKVFGGHMDRFAEGVAHMGFPAPMAFAWAAALSELVGGILIALGLQTRAAAFCVLCTMAVAVFRHHAADPLQVKELAMAYGTMAGTLLMTGPGLLSLEAFVSGGKK